MEHIHHIAQPDAVDHIPNAAGKNQAAANHAHRMPHNAHGQHRNHRHNDAAGHRQQKQLLPGKAGPGRSVIMDSLELDESR